MQTQMGMSTPSPELELEIVTVPVRLEVKGGVMVMDPRGPFILVEMELLMRCQLRLPCHTETEFRLRWLM